MSRDSLIVGLATIKILPILIPLIERHLLFIMARQI